MTQHFHAPVGQVAGGHVFNVSAFGDTPLGERTTEWLLERRDHCRRKLRAAQLVLLRDVALPLMLVGLGGSMAMLWLLVTRRLPAGASWVLPLWMAFTVGWPALRLDGRRRREAIVIRHYRRELDAIEIALYDRS